MNLTPISNHVIIEVDPAETVSKGGIILPIIDKTYAKDNCRFGTVVAIGPGKRNKRTGARLETQVSVGQKCIFLDHALHKEVKKEPRQIVCEEGTIYAVFSE